jgi:hypothetical protein
MICKDSVAEIINDNRVRDFAFLVDLTADFNEMIWSYMEKISWIINCTVMP